MFTILLLFLLLSRIKSQSISVCINMDLEKLYLS